MLDEKLDQIEKSLLRTFTPHEEYSLSPSKLDLALFRIAKWGLITSVTTLYLLAHQWHAAWGVLMTALFAYSFSGVAGAVMEYLVFLLANPILLRNGTGTASAGEKTARIAVVHLFEGVSEPDAERMIRVMKEEIDGNRDPEGHYKFILADDGTDPEIRAYIRNRLGDLQNEFGKEVVYYFHRAPQAESPGKSGLCRDLTLLLDEGSSRERPWDEILGDVRSLGLRASREDVLTGLDAAISEDARIQFVSFCDQERQWPAGELNKVVSKALDPRNAGIAMFQPRVRIGNPDESGFARLAARSYSVNEFSTISEWRLYRSAPFLAGGLTRLRAYAKKTKESGLSHANKLGSPRPLEFSGLKTALLEDVFIQARVPADKFAALEKEKRALCYELLVLEECFLKHQSPDQREYLWTLLRKLAGPTVFSLWLLGTAITWLFHGISNGPLLWILFISIAGVYLGLTGFLAPYFNRFFTRSKQESLRHGLMGAGLSILLDCMDAVCNPQLLIDALRVHRQNKDRKIRQGRKPRGETPGLSLAESYRSFSVVTFAGLFLLFSFLTGFLPAGLAFFLSPYIAGLLLGPWVVWLTAKSARRADQSYI
jgi:hypothetical protein